MENLTNGYLSVESRHKQPRSQMVSGDVQCYPLPHLWRGTLRRGLAHEVYLSANNLSANNFWVVNADAYLLISANVLVNFTI